MELVERSHSEVWGRGIAAKYEDSVMRWFLTAVNIKSAGRARAGNFRLVRTPGKWVDNVFVPDESGNVEQWVGSWREQAES